MKKVCKECGEYKEHYAHGLCNKCYQRQWRRDNPEKVRRYQQDIGNMIICKICQKEKRHYGCGLCKKCYRKQWSQKHKKERQAYQKQYYLNHKEEHRLQSAKWRKENPEKAKASNRKSRRKRVAKKKAYDRLYRKNHADIRRENKLKRRINGTIKRGIVDTILNENVFKYGIIACEKCKRECEDNYHIDHVIPISKGGTNNYDNLQILCAKCNHEKYVDIVDYKNQYPNSQLFLIGAN